MDRVGIVTDRRGHHGVTGWTLTARCPRCGGPTSGSGTTSVRVRWIRHFGPGAEDVPLGGSALVAALPRVAAGYWEESGLRATREGSRLSIALLRRLVRRRPTLLLGTVDPPDAERLAELAAALEQAAEYPTARGAVLADVRLLVGEDPRHAYPHPFPVGTVPVPAVIALREVRALLGPGGRIQVLAQFRSPAGRPPRLSRRGRRPGPAARIRPDPVRCAAPS